MHQVVVINRTGSLAGTLSLLRKTTCITALGFLMAAVSVPATSQSSSDIHKFFEQDIGLTRGEVAAIESGQPVAKTLPSREPNEVFLFAAVYINAAPETYLHFSHDFERMRRLPNNLAFGVFSNPPQLPDLQGFAFDGSDFEELKSCRPADCLIQMPASSIQELQSSIDWSAPDANQHVNQLLQKTAMQLLLNYRRQGNQALGVFNDKKNPTDVSKQFSYMLSYSKALPARLPDFYNYLLAYPNEKPANVEDAFYWSRVKFGLKPTLRIVHMVTMRGDEHDSIAYAIAEKQLYASHYFETALDLSFCVRGDRPKQTGFYLIKVLGSEQQGLTGVKGAMVRKAAVGRSVSNLQNALTHIKSALETTS